jgi:hypothetical protein
MWNDLASVHDHSGVVEQPVQHGDGGGVLGVVVRRRCCPRDLAVQPTKRSAMSLTDSWSLVVMVVPPCWFVGTCPAITGDACEAGPG